MLIRLDSIELAVPFAALALNNAKLTHSDGLRPRTIVLAKDRDRGHFRRTASESADPRIRNRAVDGALDLHKAKAVGGKRHVCDHAENKSSSNI